MSEKTLIVYYSWSGTTTRMAKLLQKITESKLEEIKVSADTFSNDMNKTSEIANQQIASGDLPEVNKISKLDDYDLILVGSPVWSGQVATPIRSFLKQVGDFNGKIAQFHTSAGSDDKYEADFEKLLNGLKVNPGLGMTSGDLSNEKSATAKLSNWIQELN
ncbi:flavodoxin [Companilactobacillus kimchiensis]|uniref:Flavodoxin-like domain-containing protein n=1 Tax=Companilactobacillus kimchiensis TaxID=993692 RepID=A0A0R2LFP7_9LACO|nr:flavodoxin [Companilactobacillus kimchiensis]KRN98838.1 hypothetical protein IV57_GL000750 [Companilactobacillus kimchiensis]